MIFKRGKFYWYDFALDGTRVRESTKLTNKNAAKEAESERFNALVKGRAGIKDRPRVMMFSSAAEKFLAAKKSGWAPHTHRIESISVAHLNEKLGSHLLNDISADAVGEYRDARLADGASPKTTANELGTLRAVLRFFDQDAVWRTIAKRIKLAPAEKVGRCISIQEESALLAACRASRSRSILVAVVLSLEAGLRRGEIRLLRWRNVDLGRKTITVGQSKTRTGEGRIVPMSSSLFSTLTAWAAQFPDRKLADFVFPSEKYGEGGKVYSMDAATPTGTFKVAWHDARKRAGVDCRFHDLRHSRITRLLESGADHMTVAEIAGWSTSTAIRMIREVYGHTPFSTRRNAIEQSERFLNDQRLAASQNTPRFEDETDATIQ